MRSCRWRTVFVLCSLFFALSEVALAQSVTPARRAAARDGSAAPDRPFIPESLGHVSAGSINRDTEAPIVFHIQDIHVNHDAQQNAVAILRRLIRDYGVGLVLMEGGEGDATLSLGRGLLPDEARRRIAEDQLSRGLLSAPEFLSAVSDPPLQLWGVEDAALFEQNAREFIAAETMRRQLEAQVDAAGKALRDLEEKIFNPALRAFIENRRAYREGAIGFDDYAQLVVERAAQAGIAPHRTAGLRRFLDLEELKAGIAMDRVAAEQREALQTLEGDLSALTDLAARVRAGEEAPLAYYRALSQAMAQRETPTEAPNLRRLLEYYERSESIDARMIADELAELDQAVPSAMAVTEDERRLLALSGAWFRLVDLINLEWSPREYEHYMSANESPEDCILPLRALAGRHGVAFPDDLADATEAWAPALRFYELARARDAAMAERIVRRLAADPVKAAALFTGGFHTERLSGLLAKAGIHTVVITPAAGEETGERYAEVIRFKQGLAPLPPRIVSSPGDNPDAKL